MSIDLNRGVTKRIHLNGIQVCMYKDAPGVYYDAIGNELTEDFAKQAGFDISYLKKEREKMDKLSSAKREIEKEYAEIEGEVVGESDDYEVVCVSQRKNRYDVVKKGSKIPVNEKHMSKEQATEYAKSLKSN